MKEMVVKESKKLMLRYAIICAIMIFAFIIILKIGNSKLSHQILKGLDDSEKTIFMVIESIYLAIFVLMFFHYLVKSCFPKSVLKFKKEGIVFRSSIYSTLFIAWDEIESICDFMHYNQRYIGLNVYDCNKYLKKLSHMKRKQVSAGLENGFPLILIPASIVDIPSDRLLKSMQQMLKEYKKINEVAVNAEPMAALADEM